MHKFGGSVLRTALDFARLKRCLTWFSGWRPSGIVISALGKTTSALEATLQVSHTSRTRAINQLHAIAARFARLAQQILTPGSAHQYCQWLAQTLAQLQKVPWTYGTLIPWGERWTAQLACTFLQEQGFRIAYLPATEWMVATGAEDNSTPVPTEIARYFRRPASADFILTEGFIARPYPYNLENTHTLCTLGREGSDLTATLLARVAQATRVIFWKGTGALWNADPTYFQDALPLSVVHRGDAYLLASLGGKILHWRALNPILNSSIQVEFRSLSTPWQVQTRILDQPTTPPVPLIVLRRDLPTPTLYVIGNPIRVQWRHPWIRGAIWETQLGCLTPGTSHSQRVLRLVGRSVEVPRVWRTLLEPGENP